MLQNSFIQIPGIGPKKEKSIWNDGVLSWNDFLNRKKKSGLTFYKSTYFPQVETCLNKLDDNDINYFYNTLPSSDEWRLFKEFQNHCLYLDIETNGGDFYYGYITTIATYDGKKN